MSANPADARVVVSIVNYGIADMVLANVPHVLAELSCFAEGHLVIVDNASPNGDGETLATGLAAMGSPAGATLIRSPRNGGFAAGNNLAFDHARGLDWTPDAVLLLNPDALLRPGAIMEMVRVMQSRPKIGAVGARLENEDGSFWVASFHFPTLMSEFSRELALGAAVRRWPVLIEDSEIPVQADWVSGACLMLSWPMIEALGPLDEEYFLYFEEVDYQLHARRAGWEVWHAPQAVVMHVAGASTGISDGAAKVGRTPAYWFASWRRYYEKNHGTIYARGAAAAKLLGMVLGTAQKRMRGKPVRQTPHFLSDFARSCLFGGSAGRKA